MSNVLIYTVLSGDTLSSIASNISASAGISIAQIESTNPGLSANDLQIGQLIKIPFATSSSTWQYTICSGDSFASIASALAQCHGLTYEHIENNDPRTKNGLQVGQRINIPATKVSEASLAPQAPNMGYWHWTWSGANNPNNATLSMAFSGWSELSQVAADSAVVKNTLVGEKYITFGGGNEKGSFNASVLNDLNTAIIAGKFSDYDGIAYDVEEGDAGLANDFAMSFKAAKSNNLKVLVTVSHSAPYGIVDADNLMQAFFSDGNIDILSPQLYTTGEETANNYQLTAGTSTNWKDYANCIAVVAPSIVSDSLYPSAENYFKTHGVELKGYIQWQQVT